MLRLVSPGARTVYLKSNTPNQLVEYLTEHFACEELSSFFGNYSAGADGCLIGIIADDNEKEHWVQVSESAELVLGTLITSEAHNLIQAVITPPPAILFNSLGDTRPVLEKIQKEFQAEVLSVANLKDTDRRNGVLVLFLESDGSTGKQLAQNALFIRQDYDSTLDYLKIHAPRYLAKAFEPNVWHMVDLRIYDRFEAYDLQYQRLVYAIQKLRLGYIVSETWNRELGAFSEPVGTYGIRLLTFLEPLQLKKALIGLEYGRENGRIVDLDIVWHGKKLSWKNLLDNKDIRKDIKELSSFFPKSSFFAIQNEKAALIKYCIQQLEEKMTEEDKNFLKEMETQIRATDNTVQE